MNKRLLSGLLALVMVLSLGVIAFAAEFQPEVGEKPTGANTSVSYVGQGNEEYTITVPPTLAPGGSGEVYVTGTWASDKEVVVTCPDTVTLTNSIKASDTKELAITFAGISKTGDNQFAITKEDTVETVSVANISDALFGTWSGTISFTIGIQDTAELIEFTISGRTYQAEEGMTWAAWCDSDYNTSNYYINNGIVSDQSGGWIETGVSGGQQVQGTATITANHAYGEGC